MPRPTSPLSRFACSQALVGFLFSSREKIFELDFLRQVYNLVSSRGKIYYLLEVLNLFMV